MGKNLLSSVLYLETDVLARLETEDGLPVNILASVGNHSTRQTGIYN